MKYQGCADAGVCYPPQTRTLAVALPQDAATGTAASEAAVAFGMPAAGAAWAAATAASPLLAAGATARPAAAAGAGLRLRGDRRRRQHAAAALHPGAGLLPVSRQDVAETRCAPAAQGRHHPGSPALAARRRASRRAFRRCRRLFRPGRSAGAGAARTRRRHVDCTLTSSFQGCQTDGICYPPMTRTLAVSPAGRLRVDAEAAATGEPSQRRLQAADAKCASGTLSMPRDTQRRHAGIRLRALPTSPPDAGRRHPPRRRARRHATAVDAARLLRLRPAAGVHALRAADDPDPVGPDRRPRRTHRRAARVLAVVRLRAGQCAGVHRRRRRSPGWSAPTCRRRSRRRGCWCCSRCCSWRWRCRCSACTSCSCRQRCARGWARSATASAAARGWASR